MIPHLQPVPTSDTEAFELKIHELDPEDFAPNGDRYVVERIKIDEAVLLASQLLVVTGMGENDDDRKPHEKPAVEKRGVVAAVVCAVGNGHLLGYADYAPDGDGVRAQATVPMFYAPGDVVLVDMNAKGRNLRMAGREVRIINQIDVLTGIPKIKLARVGKTWQRVEVVVEVV